MNISTEKLRAAVAHCNSWVQHDLDTAVNEDTFDRAYRYMVRAIGEFCEWAVSKNYDLRTALECRDDFLGTGDRLRVMAIHYVSNPDTSVLHHLYAAHPPA